MAVKAYVFVTAEVGKSRNVLRALRQLRGVMEADAVTGEYDLAAIVTVERLEDIQDLVTVDIQSIVGIVRTKTFIATGWHE